MNYTYDSNIYRHGHEEVEIFVSNRLILLAVVKQAKEDVLYGVMDDGIPDDEKPYWRGDALAYFCDGRWIEAMKYCAVSTDIVPAGVTEVLTRVAARVRAEVEDCPETEDDCELAVWAHQQGRIPADSWEEEETVRRALRPYQVRNNIHACAKNRDGVECEKCGQVDWSERGGKGSCLNCKRRNRK